MPKSKQPDFGDWMFLPVRLLEEERSRVDLMLETGTSLSDMIDSLAEPYHKLSISYKPIHEAYSVAYSCNDDKSPNFRTTLGYMHLNLRKAVGAILEYTRTAGDRPWTHPEVDHYKRRSW